MLPINKVSGYRSWLAMKDRCYNKRCGRYKDYGGKGISICDDWRRDFRKFISDMGPRPSKRHSIERIDNTGNYEPGNCKWATPKEQANNRASNKLLTFNGLTLNISQWSEKLGLKRVTIQHRLNKGLPISEVLDVKLNACGAKGKEVMAYEVKTKVLILDSNVRSLTKRLQLPTDWVGSRLRKGNFKPYRGFVIVYDNEEGRDIINKYISGDLG